MMTDPRRQPIAAARPMVDPTLAVKAELRVRHSRWAQLAVELAAARADLAAAITSAHDAGLSYERIGKTLARHGMFVHRLYQEGKRR